MSVTLAAFALALVKSAEEKKEKRPSYLRQMVAGLPVLTGQALSDIPEGAIEGTIESSIRERKFTPRMDVGGLRFGSRIAAGALTTPVFMSGMSDITNAKSKKDEHRGMAKLLTAGGIYAGVRGGIESKFSRDLAKKPKSWRYVAARAGMGIGGAGLTGLTVGRALRHEKKDPTVMNKYVAPAAVGAGLSSGKALIEELALEGGKALSTSEGRRGVMARAAGKAGAGAVGTLLLSEIMRRALPKEKKAEAAPFLGATPNEMNSTTAAWAKKADTREVLDFYRQLELRGGERSPSARSVFYSLHDELKARGVQGLPTLKHREDASGLVRSLTPANMAVLVGVGALPEVTYRALNRLPPTDRDRVLTDALDRLYLQGKIQVLHADEAGALNPGDGFAIPEAKIIGVSRDADPAEVAHEIGHVRRGELRANTIGNEGNINVAKLARWSSIALTVAVVGSAIDHSFSTREELESKSKTLMAIGGVAGVLQAPALAEEAVANLKAMKYLSAAGASASEVASKALRNLGPAFGTYAAPVLLPFLAARMLAKRSRAESEKA